MRSERGKINLFKHEHLIYNFCIFSLQCRFYISQRNKSFVIAPLLRSFTKHFLPRLNNNTLKATSNTINGGLDNYTKIQSQKGEKWDSYYLTCLFSKVRQFKIFFLIFYGTIKVYNMLSKYNSVDSIKLYKEHL